MARTNGPIEVWSRDDTTPTDAQGGFAGGDSTAAAVGTSLDQSSKALGTVDNLAVTARTLDYGQEATATISGASPWKTIEVGIPKGMPDDVGQQLVTDSQTSADAAAQSAADAQTAMQAQFMTQDEGVKALIADGAGPQTLAALQAREPHAIVTDYGAVGDGVADDTAAIQAALDAAQEVRLPAGDYLITAALLLRVGWQRVVLDAAATIWVPSGYTGTVFLVESAGMLRQVTVTGRGRIREVGLTGGRTVPSGAWTCFHLRDLTGTGVWAFRAEQVEISRARVPIVMEVATSAGWINGCSFRELIALYPESLIETIKPTGTHVGFASNTIDGVVAQGGDYTLYGVKNLIGRNWTINNTSLWDVSGMPAVVTAEITSEASGTVISGGLITGSVSDQGVDTVILAPREQVLPWNREVILQPSQLDANRSLSTLPTDGVTSDGQWPVKVLGDGSSGLVFLHRMPREARQLTVTLMLTSLTASDGDTVWTLNARPVVDGGTLNAAASSQNVAGFAGAGVMTEAHIALPPLTAGGLYRFTLRRNGADSADTHSGDVGVLGVRLSMAA